MFVISRDGIGLETYVNDERAMEPLGPYCVPCWGGKMAYFVARG